MISRTQAYLVWRQEFGEGMPLPNIPKWLSKQHFENYTIAIREELFDYEEAPEEIYYQEKGMPNDSKEIGN